MRWIVVAGLGLAACSSNGQSVPTPERRQIAERDFSAVAVNGSTGVDIRHGAAFAVEAEGDATALDRLTVERDGDTLRIGQRSGGNWWSGRRSPVRVRITMPAIRAATLAGSGDIAIDQADDGFAGSVGGSGDMTIGQLRGNRAMLKVGGSGTIAAAGAVRHLDMAVAGSGSIDAKQVVATEATVTVAGSGDANATVNGPARVTLAGSGSTTLGAGARCTIDRSGSGDADCG